jgi:hypothetical protein
MDAGRRKSNPHEASRGGLRRRRNAAAARHPTRCAVTGGARLEGCARLVGPDDRSSAGSHSSSTVGAITQATRTCRRHRANPSTDIAAHESIKCVGPLNGQRPASGPVRPPCRWQAPRRPRGARQVKSPVSRGRARRSSRFARDLRRASAGRLGGSASSPPPAAAARRDKLHDIIPPINLNGLCLPRLDQPGRPAGRGSSDEAGPDAVHPTKLVDFESLYDWRAVVGRCARLRGGGSFAGTSARGPRARTLLPRPHR